MMKSINIDYVAQAKKLSEEERERVLSRMGGKLPKRLQKEKLTADEAIAIQLELEDEQLQEWRKNMEAIQAKATKAKLKAEEKAAKVDAEKAKKAAPKVAPKKEVKPKAKAKTHAAAKSPVEVQIPTLKK